MTASPEEIEVGTVDALHAAVAALEAKSPDDLPAYRKLVIDVAESVAEAAKGVAPSESDALETVRSALGLP
jgi:tellurite resistance protein